MVHHPERCAVNLGDMWRRKQTQASLLILVIHTLDGFQPRNVPHTIRPIVQPGVVEEDILRPFRLLNDIKDVGSRADE